MYRNDQKVRFAKGMLNIFTDDMPKRVENAVRYGVIRKTNRTYYFEYRNGSRLIPPALQEKIRQLFRDNGWTDEVKFDSYVEDYDW
jgi:predicted AAA+ superfamily ATPase